MSTLHLFENEGTNNGRVLYAVPDSEQAGSIPTLPCFSTAGMRLIPLSPPPTFNLSILNESSYFCGKVSLSLELQEFLFLKQLSTLFMTLLNKRREGSRTLLPLSSLGQHYVLLLVTYVHQFPQQLNDY